jgi:hypothetical protein
MDFLESRPVITGRILEYKKLSAVIKYKFSEYGGKKWRPEPCHRKA